MSAADVNPAASVDRATAISTEYGRRRAFEQVGFADAAISQVVARLDAGWWTLMRHFIPRYTPLIEDPD